MATVLVVVPSTVMANIIDPVSGSAGIGEAGASRDFYIKVKRMRISTRTRVMDSTGDGDSYPTYAMNRLLYQQVVLQGWMIAEFAIGLKNLVVKTKNPTAVQHRLYLGSDTSPSVSRFIRGSYMLEDVDIEWDVSSPFAGLAISMHRHDSDPAYVEADPPA